ncbi:MAG: hypothetical protein WAP03_24695 [Methylorubrum rhodinum]|jgi:hypothetical protein|uniref:hypothetical protein n=1 Tax=Methylorubrum rhodinum TaxID=29428 RepID=UPI00105540D0
MRTIHVEEGLRLRFPGRDASFHEGVEIGILAVNLASGRSEFTLRFSSSTLEQARALASQLGYRTHVVADDATWAEVTFLTGQRRPRLALVHSRSEIQATG